MSKQAPDLGTSVFDAHELKYSTNGMLPTEAYQAIFDTACLLESGSILEIGTAHGAATIALALGANQNSPSIKIITIDKITGGSRDRYGDLEANKSIIENNFAKYGVENLIELNIGTSEAIAPNLPEDIQISLLMLDADGAIDRDFELFYNKVIPGGAIIIDDFDNKVRVERIGKLLRIDQKHKLTYALVSYYESKGLLKKRYVIGNTYFGYKPEEINRPIVFKDYDVRPAYRQLTFSRAPLFGATVEQTASYISKVTLRHPKLHSLLRRLYRKARNK